MLRRFVILFLLITSLPVLTVSAQSEGDRAEVTFLFDENVSADQDALIREGIRLAQDYFIATFGKDVGQDVVVDVTNDPTNMIIEANNYLISLNVRGYAGFPPLMQLLVVVHEYFHIWQADAMGGQIDGLPTWLIEGGADFIGMQALVSAGLVSSEEARERTVLMADGVFSNAPATRSIGLEELTSYEGFTNPEVSCCAYALSTVAVEHLVGEGGPKRLGEFFTELGETGKSWSFVFFKIFGMGTNEFYADFETQRSSILAPVGVDVLQLFQLPNLNEAPANIELSSAPDSVSPDEQGLFIAWSTNNGAACTMIVTDGQGNELVRYAAYADSYGLVVWLWTPPTDLDEALVSAQFDCGASPVMVDIPIS